MCLNDIGLRTYFVGQISLLLVFPTTKNSAKLKQQYYFHAEFLEEVRQPKFFFTIFSLQFFPQDPERRSQLWRMTASRRLVHIESSTAGFTNMVLDIDGGRLPSKGGLVSLVLQRESSARIQSQAWRFTEVSAYDTIPRNCCCCFLFFFWHSQEYVCTCHHQKQENLASVSHFVLVDLSVMSFLRHHSRMVDCYWTIPATCVFRVNLAMKP